MVNRERSAIVPPARVVFLARGSIPKGQSEKMADHSVLKSVRTTSTKLVNISASFQHSFAVFRKDTKTKPASI